MSRIETIPAFGLAVAAFACDDMTGELVSLAVRNALFERGQDISGEDVLLAIGMAFVVEPLERASAAVD